MGIPSVELHGDSWVSQKQLPLHDLQGERMLMAWTAK